MTLKIAGKRFGKLVALRPTGNLVRGSIAWLFRCDCGETIERAAAHVKTGRIKSCRCLLKGVGMREHLKAGGPKRLEAMLRLRARGFTLAEIGRRFGITQERVRQVLDAGPIKTK